jgi:hypothetical protein
VTVRLLLSASGVELARVGVNEGIRGRRRVGEDEPIERLRRIAAAEFSRIIEDGVNAPKMDVQSEMVDAVVFDFAFSQLSNEETLDLREKREGTDDFWDRGDVIFLNLDGEIGESGEIGEKLSGRSWRSEKDGKGMSVLTTRRAGDRLLGISKGE